MLKSWTCSGRRLVQLLFCLFLAVIVSACNGNSDGDSSNNPQEDLERLTWDTSPETIIFRIDNITPTDSPARITNEIPLCTLWGDGRMVVVDNTVSPEQALQTRLDDEAITAFIREVINVGFYSWENDLLEPASLNPAKESITLNLYNEPRTIERYSAWPVDGFERLWSLCREVAGLVPLVPVGGWLTATEVPRDTALPAANWITGAPFTLAELAQQTTPRWVESPLIDEFIWQLLRSTSNVQLLEADKAYEVALQVPGVSRDSLPAPDGALVFALPAENGEDNIGLFEWERSPETILLRIDSYRPAGDPFELANDLPLCTIWGDGRLIFVNETAEGEEVLEARLSEDQIRSLIENIITLGFYDWESDLSLVANENSVLTQVELNLKNSARTVKRFDALESEGRDAASQNSGFTDLLNLCRNITQVRAVFLPAGGWLSAVQTDFDPSLRTVIWPADAPLRLADLAAANSPRWIESPFIDGFVWGILRQGSALQLRERNHTYQIKLEVPGISRTSPPSE